MNDIRTIAGRWTGIEMAHHPHLRTMAILALPWREPDDVVMQATYLNGLRTSYNSPVPDASLGDVLLPVLVARFERGNRRVLLTPTELVLEDDNTKTSSHLKLPDADPGFSLLLGTCLGWLDTSAPAAKN